MPIDSEGVERVREMRAKGKTWREIGEALGLPFQSIHRKYRRHQRTINPERVVDEGTPAEVLQRHDLSPEEWRCSKFKTWEAQKKGGQTIELCSSEFRRIDPGLQAFIDVEWKPRPRVPWVEVPAQQFALVVPDSQIGYSRDLDENLNPYHDREALDLCVQVAQKLSDRLAFIVFSGDMLDCAENTRRFSRPAAMQRTFWPALLEWRWLLERFRAAAPHAHLYALEGNHEQRLKRVLVDAAPELADLPPVNDRSGAPLLSIERLLGLDEIDVQYLGPYGSKEGELFHPWGVRFDHGDVIGSKGGQTAAKMIDGRVSRIVGHVHRQELAWATRVEPNGTTRDIFAGTFGCTCKTTGEVPSNRPHMDWQQGFGILARASDGWVEPTPIRIRPGGKAVVLGSEMQGRDYVDDLRTQTKYPF